MFKQVPNQYFVEIDVTHRCTLSCFNCDRCVSVAPGNAYQDITVEQFKKFITQSINNNYLWKRIRLIGGEPTIHPDFDEILHLLAEYKLRHNENLKVEISSNGYTEYTKRKLIWVQENFPEVDIFNTSKEGNLQTDFQYMNIAPIDKSGRYKEYDYGGCWILSVCGLGFNYSGFYCCAAAGVIAKIFEYDIAIKDVKDINRTALQNMYNTVCSKCGHFIPTRVDPDNPGTVLSPSWEKAVKQYNSRDKELKRF